MFIRLRITPQGDEAETIIPLVQYPKLIHVDERLRTDAIDVLSETSPS